MDKEYILLLLESQFNASLKKESIYLLTKNIFYVTKAP